MDEQRSSLLSCFKCTLMTGCNALMYPLHHHHVPEGYCINITVITTFILANNPKYISFFGLVRGMCECEICFGLTNPSAQVAE